MCLTPAPRPAHTGAQEGTAQNPDTGHDLWLVGFEFIHIIWYLYLSSILRKKKRRLKSLCHSSQYQKEGVPGVSTVAQR